MPKLRAVIDAQRELSDAFLVMAVHESTTEDIAKIKAEVTNKIARWPERILLPSVIIVDKEYGMFYSYDPQGLGDMVLLDPSGVVAEVGKASVQKLVSELARIRARVESARTELETASDAAEVGSILRMLAGMGLRMADAAAVAFVNDCSLMQAALVYEVVAEGGTPSTRAVLTSPALLQHKEKKRRNAAYAAMAKYPNPGYALPLLEMAGRKGVKTDELCTLVRTAVLSGAGNADVVQRVLELSKSTKSKIRGTAVEMLGYVDDKAAFERLLHVLRNDRTASVRRFAVGALARIGGELAVRAIKRAATDDKAQSVRASAAKALEGLSSD